MGIDDKNVKYFVGNVGFLLFFYWGGGLFLIV